MSIPPSSHSPYAPAAYLQRPERVGSVQKSLEEGSGVDAAMHKTKKDWIVPCPTSGSDAIQLWNNINDLISKVTTINEFLIGSFLYIKTFNQYPHTDLNFINAITRFIGEACDNISLNYTSFPDTQSFPATKIGEFIDKCVNDALQHQAPTDNSLQYLSNNIHSVFSNVGNNYFDVPHLYDALKTLNTDLPEVFYPSPVAATEAQQEWYKISDWMTTLPGYNAQALVDDLFTHMQSIGQNNPIISLADFNSDITAYKLSILEAGQFPTGPGTYLPLSAVSDDVFLQYANGSPPGFPDIPGSGKSYIYPSGTSFYSKTGYSDNLAFWVANHTPPLDQALQDFIEGENGLAWQISQYETYCHTHTPPLGENGIDLAKWLNSWVSANIGSLPTADQTTFTTEVLNNPALFPPTP